MIGGTLYTRAGARRDVVAFGAATGEPLWEWRIDEGADVILACYVREATRAIT